MDTSKYDQELLEEFIDYLRDCGEDAFYAFEYTDKAIKKFLDEKNNK